MAEFFFLDIKNGLNEAEVGFNELCRDTLRALRRRKCRNTSQSCIRSWRRQPQQCHRPKSREHTLPGNIYTHSLVSCGLVDAYRVIRAFRPLADPHQKPVNQTSLCSQWSEGFDVIQTPEDLEQPTAPRLLPSPSQSVMTVI